MARTRQSRHAARHASATRRTALAGLVGVLRQPQFRPGSALAKVTSVSAAGGLALALVVPGESASATSSDVASADRATATLASTLLDQRAEQQVSRSARAALAPAVAVQAPAVAAPALAPEYGVMSFTAVEKPPPPAPPAKSGSSSSSSAPRNGGVGYNWDAAYACSCARGLSKNSLAVLAAVKYSFPGMKSIGGVRPDSMPDHPSGRALDFMTSDRAYGDAIASMLISRAGELDIEYIIWRQRVWLPSSGWKSMSDRGGATATHYDHVHVTVH